MLLRQSAVAREVIGGAIDVHRAVGAGLFESVYHRCMEHELTVRGLRYKTQVPAPLVYEGVRLECGFRPDLIVENELLVELKSVEHLLPVHQAQTLTYLKLLGLREALLINFNVPLLKEGIRRLLL